MEENNMDEYYKIKDTILKDIHKIMEKLRI